RWARDGHRHPGRRPAAHPRHRPGLHRRGHRPARRTRRGGLPARPVVLGAGGTGLWLRRRDRGVAGRRDAGPDLPDRPGGCAMSTYSIPYVTTQSPRGERTLDIYSRLLADRIVYLGTGIDEGVANAVIAQLLHLENENPDAPIALYLNSVGGSIPATLAIYDEIGRAA